MKRFAAIAILLCGCNLTTPVEFNPDGHSAALARLAERCAANDSRHASQELFATLNEMVADGTPVDYVQRVRNAVPALGAKPARDLTAGEIITLRGVR